MTFYALLGAEIPALRRDLRQLNLIGLLDLVTSSKELKYKNLENLMSSTV